MAYLVFEAFLSILENTVSVTKMCSAIKFRHVCNIQNGIQKNSDDLIIIITNNLVGCHMFEYLKSKKFTR